MTDSTRLRSQIDEFLSALAVERGLSPNTISAYRRDLDGYAGFLDGRSPDPAAIDGYLASLHDQGRSSSTVARRLAAVRGFHKFLVAEGAAQEDPTRFAETPRRGQALPKALAVDEAIRLVEAPPVDQPLGRRDRAILETLYGTGARVSEVVDIDLSDLDLETRTAIVTGKGSKQRMVPLGGACIDAIRMYLPDRMDLRRSGSDPGALFLNARGGRLSRQGIFGIVRKHAENVGIDRSRVSPHVLRHSACDAHGRGWGGPPHGPGNPRPR